MRYSDPNGREDDIPCYIIKSAEPKKEPQKQIDSAKGSLIPFANYTENTQNQNKEQKALWGEATFVDAPGENSCDMQVGLYSLSSELNDSEKNHHIYAQGQVDILNADFSASATDGGAGFSFGVNTASISGKIGFQTKKDDRDIKLTIGGGLGIQAGGAFELDFQKGKFVLDAAFIFRGRIEASWGKRDEK